MALPPNQNELLRVILDFEVTCWQDTLNNLVGSRLPTGTGVAWALRAALYQRAV
jgi:hypothetical protein